MIHAFKLDLHNGLMTRHENRGEKKTLKPVAGGVLRAPSRPTGVQGHAPSRKFSYKASQLIHFGHIWSSDLQNYQFIFKYNNKCTYNFSVGHHTGHNDYIIMLILSSPLLAHSPMLIPYFHTTGMRFQNVKTAGKYNRPAEGFFSYKDRV